MKAFGKGMAALFSGAVAVYITYLMLFQVFPPMFSGIGGWTAQILSVYQLMFSVIALGSLLTLGTIMQYWSTAYLIGYALAAIIFLGTGLVDLTEVIITSIFALGVLLHRYGGFLPITFSR